MSRLERPKGSHIGPNPGPLTEWAREVVLPAIALGLIFVVAFFAFFL